MSCDESASLLSDSDSMSRFPLRPLVPSDIIAVKSLCSNSFPIEYPLCWFEEVVCGSLISWGLFDEEKLVGMLVAETKKVMHCNVEDRNILTDPNGYVVYILSLAVDRQYRRMGLASRLLRHLLETVIENSPYPRAIYLHVLSTNTVALKFYKRNGFVHHETILNYYRMESGYGDGCTYVRYVNGAREPVSLTSVCRSIGDAMCFPVKFLLRILAYS